MHDAPVISRLFGGAGNQLFQYAAGRALADHLGCDLALDDRYIASNPVWSGCFDHFAKARFIRGAQMPPAKSDGWLRYGLWRHFGRAPRFHRERRLGFDPGFFDLRPGTYLHGYWQSERYFGSIADRLRHDLSFTTPLDGANAEMAARIAGSDCPVALHVRRGDYVAAGAYAACSPIYYRKGVAEIASRLGIAPTCFVFSNDPDWARDNLDLGAQTVIVDINDETTGHFDMHLQSLCAHNVIANSTFSWWAAWLNQSPEKLVVAPREWFAAKTLANPDICPHHWIRI